MVGASGAIGGILGGYLLLYPRARVLVLIPLGFFSQLIRIPALWVLGFWFVLQFIQSALSSGQVGGVAYWAHIGGFIAGMVLIIPFRNKAFPLLAGLRRGTAHSTGPSKTRRRGPPTGSRRGRRPPRRGPWG